jgi:8-amino-7-oxononanoate synthase
VTHPADEFRAELAARLENRREAGLLRDLLEPAGLDLTSNDYLGLAGDPVMAKCIADAVLEHGAGSGASRLLRGHNSLFARVEKRLAAFSGRESSLIFSSGYAANVGLMMALTQSGDVVYSDALNHASIIDGLRLSKAGKRIFPHQDLKALKRLLKEPVSGRRFVVVESIYSMDGDLTDLTRVCELAEEAGATVIVDEAHATGCFGERGSGRVEELGLTKRVFATTHTGGKALGVAGAWIASCEELTSMLVNHARSFIFSTAPIPALVIGLEASVDRLKDCPERRIELWNKADWLRKSLRAAGLDLGQCDSYIIPVLVGPTDQGMALAQSLRQEGFDVRAVRPPTVPEGTTRLRITVRSNLPFSELERFSNALVRAWKCITERDST